MLKIIMSDVVVVVASCIKYTHGCKEYIHIFVESWVVNVCVCADCTGFDDEKMKIKWNVEQWK